MRDREAIADSARLRALQIESMRERGSLAASDADHAHLLLVLETQTEVLLDIREQNEKVLQNLKNMDEHLIGVAQRLW